MKFILFMGIPLIHNIPPKFTPKWQSVMWKAQVIWMVSCFLLFQKNSHFHLSSLTLSETERTFRFQKLTLREIIK